MKITGNKVHIAPLTKKTVSPGGIHLPMAFNDDEKLYLILGVGPGRRTRKGLLIPPDCQPGQRAVVDIEYGSTLLPDGTRIVNAGQVLAVW